jgi:hypothetical protein
MASAGVSFYPVRVAGGGVGVQLSVPLVDLGLDVVHPGGDVVL